MLPSRLQLAAAGFTVSTASLLGALTAAVAALVLAAVDMLGLPIAAATGPSGAAAAKQTACGVESSLPRTCARLGSSAADARLAPTSFRSLAPKRHVIT